MPKRYKQGDQLHISAYAWNRMLDMVGYEVDANSDWRKGSFPTDWFFCKLSVDPGDVAALTDGILPRGSPVKVKSPIDLSGVEAIEYETNPQDFIHKAELIQIDGYYADILGITMEPINLNPGESFIGRVAINGIVYANLKLPDPFGDIQRGIYRYVHPLPSSDPDFRTKLMANTSGFAQMVGDHIILGRKQPLFTYEMVNSENLANIYGLSGNFSGLLVLEDVAMTVPTYNTNVVSGFNSTFIPLTIGDRGVCVYDGFSFMPISGVPQNFVGKTTSTGTARDGDDPGSGFAKLYRASGSPATMSEMLDNLGNPVIVKYLNLASATVASDVWVQLKIANGNLYIDYEECVPPPP